MRTAQSVKTMMILACGLTATLSLPVTGQTPLGTAFTYQGRLKSADVPADGAYDLRFRLYDAAAGGSQAGPELCRDNVSIAGGLFTVELDFGAQFPGQERFLEIDVRQDTGLDCTNPSGFETLAPRQRLTAAPNALFSLNAEQLDGLDSTAFLQTGSAAGGDLSGTYPNPTVAGLQTRPVDPSAPSGGQVLKWNGTAWAPAADDASSLTLPFSGSANVGSGAAFSVTNTATSGTTYGGYFQSASTEGNGVFGWASATSGTNYGVWGESESTSGTGVYGYAAATSGTNYGGRFQSDSTSGRGVYGLASTTSGTNYGVWGESSSTSGRGVLGYAAATSGTTYGGYFQSSSTSGRGVYGVAAATSGTNYGVYGYTNSSSGYGVYCSGQFAATGTKSFQIDHPLNPENFYLNHYCTEGPEPMNAYSGNVVTDAQGYAVVQLPDYFESINRDFRYQLTVVDEGDQDFFVLAKVVRKIKDNRFTIRTNAPRVEVSWRVEAVRNDRWVQQYGFQTVQEKEDEIKGKYVQPELCGMPKEKGIHYRPEMERPNRERERSPHDLPDPAGDVDDARRDPFERLEREPDARVHHAIELAPRRRSADRPVSPIAARPLTGSAAAPATSSNVGK